MESHGIEPVTIFVSSLPDNLGIEFPCSFFLEKFFIAFRASPQSQRVTFWGDDPLRALRIASTLDATRRRE
jgi:hypothetical protein